MYGLIATITALLSDLLGRFTSTRAEKIDLLDTSISSRAPAATAMSKAVWTDALAELLDATAGQPIVPKAPVAGGIVQIDSTVPASGSFTDVVNLASADGYLTKLCFSGANFFSAELIVDGQVVWSVADKYGETLVIGSFSVDGAPIHFRSNLRLRCMGPITVTFNYVRTR